MNKKKSIWTFVLAFVLIMPAMFLLSACGGHKHSFAQEWSKDGEYHWHACTGEGCTEVDSKTKHNYTNEDDTDCDTCGYVRTIAENEVVSESVISKVYNGKTQAIVQGVDFTVTHGEASVSYKLKDSTDNFTVNAPVNAGTYLVKIVVPASSTYKSASKTVEYTIEKINMNEVLKNINPAYNGTETYEERVFKGENSLANDSIFIRITFPNKNVGTECSGAELYTTNTDKTVLNNYAFDAKTFKVSRTGKFIYLDSTKNRKLTIKNSLEGGFTQVELDSTNFGILEGDEVYLVIEKTYEWPTNSEIKLVIDAKDYKVGENEVVKLGGVDKDKYQLYMVESAPASAKYTKIETKVTGADLIDSTYKFGANGDSIAYGATSFVINKAEGKNWSDQMFVLDEKDKTKDTVSKEVKIQVWCGSSIIATMYRVGSKCLDKEHNINMDYAYNNGSYNNDTGIAIFKLLKNVSGYTDEEGRWICETPSATLSVQLVFTEIREITATSEGVAFGGDKLLSGYTYVFRLKVNSSDTFFAISYSANLVASVAGVYCAEDVPNGEDIMYYEGEEPGFQGLEDKNIGCNFDYDVLIYITVTQGSDSSSITIKFVE